MGEALSIKAHVEAMAAYNAWANARLYADAASLDEEDRQRDVGVYFRSLFGTLVHLLQTDRVWTYLLQGGARADMVLPPPPLEFAALSLARRTQDEFFVAWMQRVDEEWLAQPFSFASGLGALQGYSYRGTHASTLSHLFNHQTHHRGQAHAALTRLGVQEPQALDLLVKGFLGE